MGSSVTVSNKQIVAALGTSERFPVGSPRFRVFSQFIGHLAEIVGRDHLGDTVGFANLCDVTSRYLSWLAANQKFLGMLDPIEAGLSKILYWRLGEQLKDMGAHPEETLKSYGLTSETFLLSEGLGLNAEAKDLARRGELTFAKLLTTSPAVFIPRG